MKTARPKNIEELRDYALDMMLEHRSGKLSAGDGAVQNSAIRNVISSCATQLKYAQLRQETPELSFLAVSPVRKTRAR